MSKARVLVERLDFCRETSPGKWKARCPAHDDHSPSLSIKDLDGGRVLIHCHAGCSPESVVSSVGLHMGDLCPDDPTKHYSPITRKRERDITDVLVIAIAKETPKQGGRLTEAEKDEVMRASLRGM